MSPAPCLMLLVMPHPIFVSPGGHVTAFQAPACSRAAHLGRALRKDDLERVGPLCQLGQQGALRFGQRRHLSPPARARPCRPCCPHSMQGLGFQRQNCSSDGQGVEREGRHPAPQVNPVPDAAADSAACVMVHCGAAAGRTGLRRGQPPGVPAGPHVHGVPCTAQCQVQVACSMVREGGQRLIRSAVHRAAPRTASWRASWPHVHGVPCKAQCQVQVACSMVREGAGSA